MRRPQAPRCGRRRAALDHNLVALPISRSFALPLRCCFPLSLSSLLSRNFPLELFSSKQGLINPADHPTKTTGAATTPRRRQQGESRLIKIAKQCRIGAHPINRATPNALNSAVNTADNFAPLDEDKQTHPLMRRIKDSGIAPGQPSQILTINAEFLRSLNDVAEMLTQGTSRSLVAKMRKRCRSLRKHRHQRLIRIGRLGLQSGPGPPRRLKIRLIAGIDNGFSLPSRSRLSHTKLAFAQPRLKPLAPLHRAAQCRLKPQRPLALQHSAKLRNAMRRTLLDAHRIGALSDPSALTAARANYVVEMQSQRPRPLTAGRTSKPRPRAAARKSAQMDTDALLDVAELDAERRRLGRDDVQRPQARDGKGWKILAVCWYHIKLDSTPLRRYQCASRVRPTACP